MRCCAGVRIAAAIAFALVLSLVITADADSQGRTYRAVRYEPPVSGAVVDPFRPPAHIGAPGNRGLEYGNALFSSVHAAADGVVWFAGNVAGDGVVSIFHADGVKTTYTGLSEISAVEGSNVSQGASLGTAGRNIHFGAILGDHYLDPQILIDASEGEPRPRLIPVDD